MIIDTHIHCYDPERPQGIPFPRKDDTLLYRQVLPEHFLQVANPVGVTHAVVVEASRAMDDNLWILDLASTNVSILGFVAGLDPKTALFRGQLRQLAEFPVLRGIRLRQDELKNLSAAVVDNLEMVRDLHLSLDVLAHPDDRAAILELADYYPDLPIIVNHICHLEINGSRPTREQSSLLHELASRANIYCKVSAIQERCRDAANRNDLEHYRPMLDGLWHNFGENRLVYGSNWPVCERAASYASQFAIIRSYFTAKGEAAARKFLGENAQQAYGLTEKSVAPSPGQTQAIWNR